MCEQQDVLSDKKPSAAHQWDYSESVDLRLESLDSSRLGGVAAAAVASLVELSLLVDRTQVKLAHSSFTRIELEQH